MQDTPAGVSSATLPHSMSAGPVHTTLTSETSPLLGSKPGHAVSVDNGVHPGDPEPGTPPVKPMSHRWKTVVSVMYVFSMICLGACYGAQGPATLHIAEQVSLSAAL